MHEMPRFYSDTIRKKFVRKRSVTEIRIRLKLRFFGSGYDQISLKKQECCMEYENTAKLYFSSFLEYSL